MLASHSTRPCRRKHAQFNCFFEAWHAPVCEFQFLGSSSNFCAVNGSIMQPKSGQRLRLQHGDVLLLAGRDNNYAYRYERRYVAASAAVGDSDSQQYDYANVGTRAGSTPRPGPAAAPGRRSFAAVGPSPPDDLAATVRVSAALSDTNAGAGACGWGGAGGSSPARPTLVPTGVTRHVNVGAAGLTPVLVRQISAHNKGKKRGLVTHGERSEKVRAACWPGASCWCWCWC